MKADIQKILLTGEDRPDLYSVHKLQDVAPLEKPQIIAEFSGRPVNYPADNGFAACELNLIPEQNWEFEYVNRKNNFTSYFNDRTDPTNPTLASFEIINSQGVARWINYKMAGITGASQGIPEGNTIIYYEVFPGIDLRYIVDTWRLKEDIIINQPVEHYGYKFTLKLDANVSIVQQEDGSIDFVDVVTGERLWGIAKPYAKDASGKETWGVRYSLGKELYNGVEYDSVEVVIEDTEFIQNAVYPITLDPTTTNYNAASNKDDGYLTSRGTSYPPTTIYGTADSAAYMIAQRSLDSSGYFWIYEMIMGFNTSSLPDSATITGASLDVKTDTTAYRLDYTPAPNFALGWISGYTSPIADSMYSGGSPSANAYAGKAINTFANSTLYNFVLLSPNSYISKTGYTGLRGFISGGVAPSTNGAVDNVRFLTTETLPSAPPKLNVTYNIAPTTPTLTAPNGGETYNASATITWTAATDADGDALTYDIDYSPDNGSTWVDIVSGVSGTSYTWNTSALTAGSLYLVRIRAYDGTSYSSFDQSNGVFTIQHNQTPTAPTSLLIEGATNPTYVLDTTPEFSAIFNDPDTGDTTTKVEVQVGTTDGGSDKWNSGILTIASTAKGARCPDIAYAGSALQSRTLYYVQLRFTDAAGAVSAWVKGQFTMGWLHKIMGITPSKIGGSQPKKVLSTM